MVILGDIRKVAEIADKLRGLGVPENVCRRIDVWNKEREKKLQGQIAKEK